MGARPYDPGTGRFTTRDTIIGALTAPVSLHRYLYANADPINHTDPDGHWPQWLDDAAAAVAQTIDAIVDGATDIVNSVVESEAWHDVTSAASRGWHATGNRAQQLATGAGRFWDEHGDQIKANAASIAVGAVAFAGCEALAVALSGGAATPLCMAAAGAAGGAVYGHMTCPDGRTQTNCIANGALSGAVSALTLAVAGPLGPVAAGMLSGFTGDATDQLLTTGSYDPVRGAIATATGGALGRFGGRFTRTPSSKLRIKERRALKAPTACKEGPNSFVAGTLVLMADGTRKPIEQIRVGDKVLASDPDAVRTEPETVETTIVGQGTKNLVDITIDTDGAAGSNSSILVATDQHPFWVQSEHRWVDARDLRPGDLLRTAAGTFVQVTAIHTRTETTHVYNLTVSPVHTYYLLAGDQPVLVHNCGTGKAPRTPEGKFATRNGEPGRDGAGDEMNAWDQLEMDGANVMRNETPVSVPGMPVRKYDGTVEIDGQWYGIEIKGGTAKRNPAQKAFDDWLNTPGNIVTTKDGRTLVGVFDVWIDR